MWERRAAPRSAPALGAAAACALAATLATAPGLEAQRTRELDGGSFELRVDGRTAGTETFAIRREPGVIRAVARVVVDSAAGPYRPREVWLQTDGDYRPNLLRLRPPGEETRSILVRREGERLRVQTTTPEGDLSREFVAPPDLSMLEPSVAHHYFLLLRQHRESLSGGGVHRGSAFVPSRSERVPIEIRRLNGGGGAEDADPSGTAHEVRIDGAGARVWSDPDGRIVRVEALDGAWGAVRRDERGDP